MARPPLPQSRALCAGVQCVVFFEEAVCERYFTYAHFWCRKRNSPVSRTYSGQYVGNLLTCLYLSRICIDSSESDAPFPDDVTSCRYVGARFPASHERHRSPAADSGRLSGTDPPMTDTPLFRLTSACRDGMTQKRRYASKSIFVFFAAHRISAVIYPSTGAPWTLPAFQVDDELARECAAPGGSGILGALSRIVRRHGRSGLWRGMVPVLITMGVSNFVYFYCFNGMKV